MIVLAPPIEPTAWLPNAWLVGDGVTAASPGSAATVHVRRDGVGSVLCSASRAQTRNVCWPSDRPVNVIGDSQSVSIVWLSSRQLKTAPGSDENSKVAVVSVVVPTGPDASRVVSGATVSTVHVRLAGVGSTLPAASFACTENVCEPWPRPE